jgi:hypothetical protein
MLAINLPFFTPLFWPCVIFVFGLYFGAVALNYFLGHCWNLICIVINKIVIYCEKRAEISRKKKYKPIVQTKHKLMKGDYRSIYGKEKS